MNLSSFPQRAINNGNIKKWRKRHSKGSTTVTHVFEKAENFQLNFPKRILFFDIRVCSNPWNNTSQPAAHSTHRHFPPKIETRSKRRRKKYVPFGEINVIHISAREEKRIPSPPPISFLPPSFRIGRDGKRMRLGNLYLYPPSPAFSRRCSKKKVRRRLFPEKGPGKKNTETLKTVQYRGGAEEEEEKAVTVVLTFMCSSIFSFSFSGKYSSSSSRDVGNWRVGNRKTEEVFFFVGKTRTHSQEARRQL